MLEDDIDINYRLSTPSLGITFTVVLAIERFSTNLSTPSLGITHNRARAGCPPASSSALSTPSLGITSLSDFVNAIA
jgi:hypothetical protein